MARGELTPYELKVREIISRNINELISNRDVTQVDVHNHTGIPRSTLTGYVKGTSTPNAGNIQKLADFFNVPKSAIDPRYESKIVNMKQVKEMRAIPVLGDIACGDPITAEENIQGYRDEVADTLPTGNLFYLHCKGDSMAPTIPNGAYVLIRQQPDVEDGEIAAVLVNGDTEATLKRIKRQGSLVMLMPDNQSYDPYVVTPDNPARILGKALKMSADL